MTKYIAILRGINVSGHKLIKMAELVKHLEELKFHNIKTYIQSGNILFQSDSKNQEELAKEIGNKIKEKYGWEVPVIVISAAGLKNVAENNPFIIKRQETIDKLYVTFLANEPDKDLSSRFKEIDYKPDEFVIEGKVLYGFVPDSYGNTKFSNNFIEGKLKTSATTRNWKTVLKLLELSGD